MSARFGPFGSGIWEFGTTDWPSCSVRTYVLFEPFEFRNASDVAGRVRRLPPRACWNGETGRQPAGREQKVLHILRTFAEEQWSETAAERRWLEILPSVPSYLHHDSWPQSERLWTFCIDCCGTRPDFSTTKRKHDKVSWQRSRIGMYRVAKHLVDHLLLSLYYMFHRTVGWYSSFIADQFDHFNFLHQCQQRICLWGP